MPTHQTVKLILASLFVLLLACPTLPTQETFPLQIDHITESQEPWPIIGGLPFPEGALTDPEQIRLTRDGEEIPVQINIASRWRDGSIRWALAGFTADPDGDYQVTFGGNTEPMDAPHSLLLDEDAAGHITVDTGKAVYEFPPDQLLPDSARMGDHLFLADSGQGAYLIDNRGRLSRVSGAAADIHTEILQHGPERTVLYREGWYVTEEGERVARAKAWFYLSAGVPFMKVTHSLILTQDTNELWVRDYGLEFRTPETPKKAVFALGRSEAVFTPRMREVDYEWVEMENLVGEVYLYQDTFPHFREFEHLAVVGRSASELIETITTEDLASTPFWLDDWAGANDVAGDWGDANYGEYGLTVVMPHLAERFPKEIAFTPQSARVAFWSSRGGRELDFRMPTLVTEYWREWTEMAPDGPTSLIDMPSNAQGLARTHDVWLLPRNSGESVEKIAHRAETASYPHLVLPDPFWTASTDAFGWPFHPRDPENLPLEEAFVESFWQSYMNSGHQNEPYIGGFIDWGKNPPMRRLRFSRLHSGTYNLPLHIWGAYVRSGARSMFNYGSRYNQFVADVRMSHWTAGDKFEGGRTAIEFMNKSSAPPVYWADASTLDPFVVIAMHSFLSEYYLTGNEHIRNVVESYGRAFKERWDPDALPAQLPQSDFWFHYIRELVALYEFSGDEAYADLARKLVRDLVDLDNPNALTDEMRFGNLYKVDRNILWLMLYYQATGDDLAKQAALQALDYKYRFSRFRLAGGSQDYAGLLYGMAYALTGDPRYLRVVDYQHRVGLARFAMTGSAGSGILANRFPTINLPGLLAVLADHEGPIETFPVLQRHAEPAPSDIIFRKTDGPVSFHATVWMEEPHLEPEIVISPHFADSSRSAAPVENVTRTAEQAFMTQYESRQNPRIYYVEITMPGEAEPGLYFLEIPGSEAIRILETNASEIAVYGPQGIEIQGDAQPNFFHVNENLETLELMLGVPMEIRRPDGSIALEASEDDIGLVSLQVEGNGGAWSVATNRPGPVIRFLNVEPLVARSPEWLVTEAGLEPAERFQSPGDTIGFVESPGGQALHLPGGNRLAFRRGDPAGDRFAHFPTHEGTIEFWFRPNWSSLELPYVIGANFNDKYFVRAHSHDFQYRRGRRRPGNPELTNLNLWVRGEADANAGFTGGYLFEAGQWYHVATTWKIEDGQAGNDGEYAVYVNGMEVERDDFGRRSRANWPGGMTGEDPLVLREPAETIFIGPIDGTIANLRISDVVRYDADFEPDWTSAGMDDQTVILFELQDDLTGVTQDNQPVTLTP